MPALETSHWLQTFLMNAVQTSMCTRVFCTTCGALEFRRGVVKALAAATGTQPSGRMNGSQALAIARALREVEPVDGANSDFADAAQCLLVDISANIGEAETASALGDSWAGIVLRSMQRHGKARQAATREREAFEAGARARREAQKRLRQQQHEQRLALKKERDRLWRKQKEAVVTRDTYKVGLLVRHPLRPEWGLGKVLALDGDVIKIRFKNDHQSDYRAILLSKINFTVAEEQSDPFLDNLPPFNGKAFEVPPKRVTFEDGLKRFTEVFPLGFQDPAYLSRERDYKWQAHERFERELGGGRGGELLRSGDLDSLSRVALSIASLNLLSRFERMALKEGLANPETAKRFFVAVFDLIENGPEKSLFERAASAVAGLPAEPGRARVATWPVLTIFLYLARPDRFMFLKPQPTKDCADRLLFELQYSADLRWITYSQLLRLSATLLEMLRPYGARDYIDVQSFMWVIAKYP